MRLALDGFRGRLSATLIAAGILAATPFPSSLGQEGAKIPEGLNFANGLLRDRRYDLAADEYERFLKTTPEGPGAVEARFGLGRARLFQGRYPEARTQFEEFLKLAPDHPNAPTALFRFGESAYLMNDLAAARKALEAYTEKYPNHAHRDTAWPELGDACFKLGDLPAARRAYEKALEVEPKGRLANRSRFYLGRTLSAQGEMAEAIKILTGLMESGDAEWSGKAAVQAGQIQLASGHAAEAVEILAEAERKKLPGASLGEIRLRRAEALIALKRRDEADPLLAELASGSSRAVAAPAAFALAGSQFDQGKFDESLATSEAAILRTPESSWVPRLIYRSAEARIKLGKPDEARVEFLKVATVYPKDAWAPSALLRAARLSLDARDFAAARQTAASFPERFPGGTLRADARLIEARADLGLGKPSEAIAALETLLKEDKPPADVARSASYYLGLAYKADGQAEKSAALLGEVAKMADAPAASDAQLVLGFGHYEAKRYAEAVTALEAYLAVRPKGEEAPQALAYLALSQEALGQKEVARATLDRLAKDWPRNDALIRARIILAESALEANRFDDAAALFGPASETEDPKWKPRALSGLGWAQFQGGHHEEAAKAFSALIAAAPDDPLAADASVTLGRALEAAGKIDEAIAAYDSTLEHYARTPQSDTARLARDRIWSRTGKVHEAAEDLGKFIAEHPRGGTSESPLIGDFLVEWGWALHDDHHPAEADTAFRKLLDEYPDSPRADDARVFLAESLRTSGKRDEAARLLAPVVAEGSKTDPTLIQTALVCLGRIELGQGRAPEALAAFDRLIREYPTSKSLLDARFGKADATLQAGDATAAEAQFAELSALSGPDEGVWADLARLRRAQCLAALNRWGDVLKLADALKTERPKFPSMADLDYLRGRALQSSASFDEARAAYQAAIDAAPGSEIAARSQLMRGETYFHQKNWNEALREFHKTDLTYRFAEWRALALLEAGKVYGQLGRWADAADVFEKFRTSFPEDPRMAEVSRLLEEAKAKSSPVPPREDAGGA